MDDRRRFAEDAITTVVEQRVESALDDAVSLVRIAEWRRIVANVQEWLDDLTDDQRLTLTQLDGLAEALGADSILHANAVKPETPSAP